MRVLLVALLAATPLSVAANSADLIETIVVRAARTPIPAPDVGSSVSVLTESDLDARQVISISDVLRSIPGVAVSRSGGVGAQSQLRMRGGEANHVLVLIDGVVVNDPAQGDEFNFAHLLNYQLDSIEVTRGPQSALWGSAALSGVVNATSATPSDGQAFDLFVEGGSDSYEHIGGSAAHAGERLTARVGVNRVDTDGQNIARSGGEDDGYENTTTSLGLGYEISPEFRLDGNLRYTDSTTEFDGIDFSTGLPVDRANETDSEQFYSRVSASLDTFDGRWTHQLSVNFTDTDNLNTTENAFAVTGFDVSRAAAEAFHYTYQTSFVPSNGHTLTAAFERQEQDFKQRGPVSFADPNRDESLDWNSWVGEYKGELTENVSLLASLRHDQNSDFDDATTGRISGAWRVNDGTTKLRAAYGTGIKNPTFSERFGFFTNFIGNPDLKPEESRGWEVGIEQQLFDGQLLFQLTWFDETLEDEISGFVFEPISGGFTADNETGESERQGIEIGGKWQITDELKLGFAYTYLDATEEDSTGGQADEIRRANHIANMNLDWQANARLSINLNVDYNGEQDDFFFPPTPPFQERVSLDSFTLVNLAARFQLSPAVSLFARVENALDEDYEEIFGFSAPGRAAFAGIRYQPGSN